METIKIQICKNQKSTLQLNHYTSSAGYVGSNDGGIIRKEMQFVLSCWVFYLFELIYLLKF